MKSKEVDYGVGKIRVDSMRCVHSSWPVSWYDQDYEDNCQCGLCKVEATFTKQLNMSPTSKKLILSEDEYRRIFNA